MPPKSKTDEWFWDWAARHQSRYPRGDWPGLETEFWRTLRHIFVTKGVVEVVAEEASRLLFEDPPAFPADLPKALLAKIRHVWKTSELAADPGGDREASAKLSRDCGDCSGQGFATRFRRASLGTKNDRGQVLPDRIVLYCRCPLGRWFELTHRAKSPDLRKRIHDLQEHPFLWGHEYRHPAGMEIEIEVPEEELPAF